MFCFFIISRWVSAWWCLARKVSIAPIWACSWCWASLEQDLVRLFCGFLSESLIQEESLREVTWRRFRFFGEVEKRLMQDANGVITAGPGDCDCQEKIETSNFTVRTRAPGIDQSQRSRRAAAKMQIHYEASKENSLGALRNEVELMGRSLC